MTGGKTKSARRKLNITPEESQKNDNKPKAKRYVTRGSKKFELLFAYDFDDAVECLYPTLEDGDQYFPAYIERKIVVNGDTPCYDVYFSQDKTKVVEQEESRIRATTETGLLSYNREKFVGQEVILDGLAGRRYKGKYYIEALGLGGTLLNFKLLNFKLLVA